MTDILRKLQLTQCEMLDEIVRVCEENNLRYFLIGGTLLGAVRHKGFIPWDDDLDITMPREDYEKFCSISQTKLKNNYFLHSIDTDEKYWLRFAKVRKKGTLFDEQSIKCLKTHKEIYIDIFPLDNSNEYKNIFKTIREFLIVAISIMIYEKLHIKPVRPRKTLAGDLYFNLFHIIAIPFSIKKLQLFQKKLMTFCNKKKAIYYLNYGSNYNLLKQTIPVEKYEPAVKLEFEGKLYSAPNDYDYILNRIYGDYMTLPPIEKRTSLHLPNIIVFGDENIEEI